MVKKDYNLHNGLKKKNIFYSTVKVSCYSRMGLEMTEVLVEPLSSVLTFPLDVAKGALPIEGEVECVRQERARLPTYRREGNLKKSAQVSSQIYGKTEPFILFLIRVSKEHDLLIMREYQSERPFHTIVLVGVPAGPRGKST